MPTYEYRCRFCHQISDAFQKMTDAPLTMCPHCGKEALERIVSGGAGVIYKGEGWYVTDYSKKSSGGKEPSKETPKESSAKDTPSNPESGTETTAAEKPAVSSSKSEKSDPKS